MELILKYFSDFTPLQLQRFEALKGIYDDWNTRINVISRKDIDSLYEKHVLHSLSIPVMGNLPEGASVIDIGTGGGFPGIPLAIFYPEVEFHLVDSIRKKLSVVEAVVDALELDNVTVQHTRAEDIKGRRFDYAVSRAVAPLKELWHWSRPLLRKKAFGDDNFAPGLICLKGGDLAEEIAESKLRPFVANISDMFREEWFHEKYVLHCPF